MLVYVFRITCLSLALFFVLDIFFFSGSKVFVETGFGKQLRFFTLWSLIANFVALIFLTLSSSFKIFDKAAPFIAISASMGLFTIVLYWGLFFIDPSLVNYAGERLNFSREIYLHFAGPALLFFDAFILKKAFSDFYRITTFAFFINFGYFGWLEIFVQPNSGFPVGKITTGLPYPFMNDMSFEHRLIFMVKCFIFGAFLIWTLTNVQKKYA